MADMFSPPSRQLAAGKLPGDLLERLIENYRTPADDAVIVEASYGFDAAALSIRDETIIVKSDPITFATENAEHYLVAVNANDIACLGGVPRWMTVVALLPEDKTTEAIVETMFSGLQDACMNAGVTLLGGHTEITLGLDRTLLIGTMLGTAGPMGLLLPGNASSGDVLYLTKSVGIEGTSLLANERRQALTAVLGEQSVAEAANLVHNPGISVVRDAQTALATCRVTALHDPTEGGVATAVHEISAASGLGATIDEATIPVRSDTAATCEYFGIDPLGLLSSGALLIAAKPDSDGTLESAFSDAGIALTRIGKLTAPDSGHILVRDGDATPLPRYDADELTRALSY